VKERSNDRRVTMQDIARETGYSVNTVSHALRGLSDISPATRDMIRETAQRMGYMGNQVASSLRSGRTHTLAVILGSLVNPFYGAVADHLQTCAQARGYSLTMMCSREDPKLEQELVENAIARRADGILLFPTNASAATVERLRTLGFPYVLLSRTFGEGLDDCVVADEEAGGRLAAEHLLAHGSDSVAYIARRAIVFSGDARLKGFLRACDDLGVPEDHRRFSVLAPDGSLDDSFERVAVQTLTEWRHEGVNGLCAFNDIEAWQIRSMIDTYPALKGWDVGIVSFDSVQACHFYPSPLCSVSADYGEMAEKAIDLLRERIHGDTRPPRTVVCPVHLDCRGSCLRP